MIFKWNLYRLSWFTGVKELVRSSLKRVFFYFIEIKVRDSQYQWKHWSNMTFNEATFDREYNSKWGGNVESAFFDSQVIDRHRVNKLPEYSPNGRNNGKTYYMLGVDVGRFGCTTEVCVFKVAPSPTGAATKHLVNMYSMEAEHFGIQAINIKKIFSQYDCKIAVVDGNGLTS